MHLGMLLQMRRWLTRNLQMDGAPVYGGGLQRDEP